MASLVVSTEINMNELIRVYGKNAKRDILNYILNDYFVSDRNALTAHFRAIGSKNEALQNKYSNCHYYYKGKLWPEHRLGSYDEVHPELHSELDGLIPRLEMMERAKVHIANYLRKLLTPCSTVADIYALMPEEILGSLPNSQFQEKMQLSALTIKSDEQARIKEKHKNGYAEIKAYQFYKALFTGA